MMFLIYMYMNMHTFFKHLEDVYARLGCISEDETCIWFNLIVDFLFRELRDTPKIKRLVHV